MYLTYDYRMWEICEVAAPLDNMGECSIYSVEAGKKRNYYKQIQKIDVR